MIASDEEVTPFCSENNPESEDTRNEGNDSLQDQEETVNGKCSWLLRGVGCGHLAYSWPRLFSVGVGIIIPLFILVALSMVFGYRLSQLEGPNEIKMNDEVLATEAMAKMVGSLAHNFTAHTPRICQELYLQNRTFEEFAIEIRKHVFDSENAEDLLILTAHLEEVLPFSPEQFGEESVVSINVVEMYHVMRECGQALHPLIKSLNDQAMVASHDVGGGGLTLNWNRCLRRVAVPLLNLKAFRPESQLAHFRRAWEKDQQRLYKAELSVLIASDVPKAEARVEAFIMSINKATGKSACQTNTDAGAWFWFTVETTIGYGNQAPSTKEGRSLVYKLGFFCILAFAGILGTAGYIALSIFDDFLDRFRLHVVKEPWIECLFWGFLYYNWQYLIAIITQQWKKERLGEPFTFDNSFWFSFTSTTTIGLGDIYLEPMCIVGSDLLTFPLLFLIGFVFMSAFLGKFALVLQLLVPQSLKVASLPERLKHNNWNWCTRSWGEQGGRRSRNSRCVENRRATTLDRNPRTRRRFWWCTFLMVLAVVFFNAIIRQKSI